MHAICNLHSYYNFTLVKNALIFTKLDDHNFTVCVTVISGRLPAGNLLILH